MILEKKRLQIRIPGASGPKKQAPLFTLPEFTKMPKD